MDLMKNVPAVAWVCLTVAFLGVTTAFVVMAVMGVDGAEFRGFLNIVANLASIILGGGGLVFAGGAYRKATEAADHLNGDLDPRVQAAVGKALAAQRTADIRNGDVR